MGTAYTATAVPTATTTAAPTPAPVVAAASTSVTPTLYEPSAADVVAYFDGAGLSVRNPRINDCSAFPGCVELVTTDDVSVLRFDTVEHAAAVASKWAGDGHRAGRVVVSFLAARTPETTRPAYAQAADRAVAPAA